MSFAARSALVLIRLRTLGAASPLSRAERLTLLGLVAAGVVVSIVFVIVAGPDDMASSVFQLLVTAAFGLFAWSPLCAAVAVLIAMVSSFAVGDEVAALVALAVAVGCVVRTGGRLLISCFVGGFLISGAAAANYASPGISLTSFAAALLLATVSGAIGLLLSLSSSRESRLQTRLLAKERAEQDATVAERQRIADELHDVIAHDLTIIAMYSRVLVQPIDEDLRVQSQQTIRDAAHKALGDLRRVVEQASGPPVLAEAPRESLAQALNSARAALHCVGSPLRVEGGADDARIPRVLDHALARILRESITNILKHGQRGPVDINIAVTRHSVRMTVSSPFATARRRSEFPSGGYGLVRMTARARELGGEFTATPGAGSWIVAVSFPLT